MKKNLLTLLIIASSLLALAPVAQAQDACGGCPTGQSCSTTANPPRCSVVIVPVTGSATGAGNTTSGTCPGGVSSTGACNLGYTPLEPIPGYTSGVALNFPQLLNSIFTILITVGALLAVLMLTIGGIQYMIAEAVPNKQGGLRRAQSALYAILLIAMSYLILKTINPALIQFNLNPAVINVSGVPSASNTALPTGAAAPAVVGTWSVSQSVTDPNYMNEVSNAQKTCIQNGKTPILQNSSAGPITSVSC